MVSNELAVLIHVGPEMARSDDHTTRGLKALRVVVSFLRMLDLEQK